ncbi:hypothetical protein LNP22_09855 [Flavobacterium flavipigmentatum]|nr:hypothetical protein LNP22_09855 [Flavobacterium sp. F-70]
MRLRILNRVSAFPALASRANTEMAEIIAEAKIVDENSENIAFRVYSQDTDLDTSGFIQSITFPHFALALLHLRLNER